MPEELDKILGELNDTQYKSPQVPKPALPEEISKTPMPEVGGTKSTPGGAVEGAKGGINDLLDELNGTIPQTPGPERPKVGIPEKKEFLPAEEHPILTGLGGYFRKSGQGMIEPWQEMGKTVNRTLGLPEEWAIGGDKKGLLGSAKEYLEPTPEQKKGMEDPFFQTIPGMVSAAAVQAPATIAKYKGLGAVLGAAKVPAMAASMLEFAGVGAAERVGKESAWEMAKKLPEDILMGWFFHKLSPEFKHLPDGSVETIRSGQKMIVKAPLLGALMAGQAVYDTGDMKQGITSGIVGSMLALLSGGKGPEKGTIFEKGEGGKLLSMKEKMDQAKETREGPAPESEGPGVTRPQNELLDDYSKIYRTWSPDSIDLEATAPGVKPESIDHGLLALRMVTDSTEQDPQKPIKSMRIEDSKVHFEDGGGNNVTMGLDDNKRLTTEKVESLDGKELPIEASPAELRERLGLKDNKFTEETANKKNIFDEKVEPPDTTVPEKTNILEPEKSKPAGESPRGPSSPRLPLPAGEDFNPGQDVTYKGKNYLVNEVDPKTGKVSIYIKGEGGSIKEVDPGDLKPPSMARAPKYGLTKEQAETPVTTELLTKLREFGEKIGGKEQTIGFPEELPITPERQSILARQWGMKPEEMTGLAGEITLSDVGAVVELARDYIAEEGVREAALTMSHEQIHLLKALKLTPEENAILDKFYKPKGGADSEEVQAEEIGKILANGYGKGQIIPQSVKNVINKIMDFLRKIGNSFEGLGYNLSDRQEVNRIIRDIASGEIGKREIASRDIKVAVEKLKTTQDAFALGKTLTKEQAISLWNEYKNRQNQPHPEDIQEWGIKGFVDQMYRETVAGYVGEGESTALSKSEIESRLKDTRARIAKNVKDEVTDDFKKAHVTLSGAVDGLKKWFAPGARGPEARRTIVTMAKELAKGERKFDALDASMRDAEKAFDKMPKEDQYKFSQNASTGTSQATPELNKIEAALQKPLTDVGNYINDLAKKIGYSKDDELIHMRDDYWPGVEDATWRAKQGVTQSAPLSSSRVLEPTGFMKQKTFQDFNSRIEAGWEPVDPNPIRGQVLPKFKQELKVAHTYQMIYDMIQDKTAVILKPGEVAPPGWKAIPEPYGNTKLGKLAMTDSASQLFKNWMSRPLASNEGLGNVYRTYMTASTGLQRFQLFGLFHFGFVASEAMISRGALALNQMYSVLRGETNPLTFLKTASSVMLAPVSKYHIGGKIEEEWLHPGTSKDPRVIQAVADIERAGGGVSQEKMFTNYWVESMKKDFRDGKYGHTAVKSPMAIMEVIMKPLMQNYVPHIKLGAFEELSTELRRIKPNLTDAQYDGEMHEIWNRIDSRLGQIRWQRLFMNNSAKNFLQAVIRAPGWTGGTIMEIGGSVPDTYKFFKEWHDTGKLPNKIPDRAAYVMSLAIGTMVLNASMSALFANKDPSQLTAEDYMAFDTGEKDERGNTLRGMLPLYSKDVYAYTKAPASTLWHKMNPIVGLVYELSKNKDYYGTGITDPTTGLGTKIGDTGKYLLKTFTPFGVRGVEKVSESGASIIKSGLPPIVGVMPAPAYFSQTKATQKALELGAERMPSGGRTQEEYSRNRLLNSYFKKYTNASNNGEDTQKIMEAFSKDVQDGKLKQQDVMKFKTKLKGQPLENSVAKLSMDGAMAVWKVANDEEKRKIVPIIFKKFRNLKDPGDKQAYARDMEKISSDLSQIYGLEK